MKPKYAARLANTTERVAEIIGSTADREEIKRSIGLYLDLFERVKDWKDTRRHVSYFDLEMVPFEPHGSEAGTVEEKAAARQLEDALTALDKALRNKRLPLSLARLREASTALT
jgi:hypothetical protein